MALDGHSRDVLANSPLSDRSARPQGDGHRQRDARFVLRRMDSTTSRTRRLRHCEHVAEARGPIILDIGAESSRPGAPAVPTGVRGARSCHARRWHHAVRHWACPVSVDTAQAGGDAGRAGCREPTSSTTSGRCSEPGAEAVVAGAPSALPASCLMHMRGEPRTRCRIGPESMPTSSRKFAIFWQGAPCRPLTGCRGVAVERIVLDPGDRLREVSPATTSSLIAPATQAPGRWDFQLLAGLVPEIHFGRRHGAARSNERLAASIAAAALACGAVRGARVVRVHDVAATVDALKLWRAAGPGEE